MRLIELRLTNLNSLKGNWRINFTHEAFINEGIFAITGQTGAGKTTILDAICLALYSQTPRLGKITGSANDIMTQGTGECAAEVVIEIGGQQYCCSWYQHRAYKKAGGKLAAIKHQISELPSGKILEDATSKTAPYIQELMGMDFDQFTRSIMLAQGSFAAFLKSDIANRAALLEKITGTAIYAKISKQVFEKFRDEKHQLERLESKIAHLPVLSLEDERQLSQRLSELSDKQSQRKAQLQSLNEQWRWLDNISTLAQQLNQHQNELSHANQQFDAFAPENLRLIAANRALEIDSGYQTLTLNRQQLSALLQEKSDLDAQVPQLVAAQTAAKQIQAQCLEQEKIAQNEYQVKLPMLKQVQQLDSQILQLSSALAEDASRKSALTQQLSNLEAQITRQQIDAHNANERLTEVQNQLKSQPDPSALIKDIDRAQELRRQLGEQLEAKIQDDAQQAALEQIAKEGSAALGALAQKRAKAQDQAERQKQQLLDLEKNIDEDNQETLQHQRYLWANRLEKLSTLQERLQHLKDANHQINVLVEQQSALSRLIQESSKTIEQLQDAIDANQATRHDKLIQLQLLQKVTKLEDYITELEAGAPCPLCGATEHPYQNEHPHLAAATNPSSSQQLQALMASLDERISRQQQQLSELQIKIADLNARLEHQHQLKSGLYEQSWQLLKKLNSESTELLPHGLKVDEASLPQLFAQISANLTKHQASDQPAPLDGSLIELGFTQLHDIKMTIDTKQAATIAAQDALAKKTAAIEATRQALNEQQQQLLQFNQDHQQLAHDLRLNQSHLDHSHHQTSQQREHLIALIDKFIFLINKHPQRQGFDALTALKQKLAHNIALQQQDCRQALLDCEQFNQQLLQLQAQFVANHDAKLALSEQLTTLNANIKAQKSQLQQDQNTLAAMERVITDKQQQQQAWQLSREQLFGGNPDEEAARLQKTIDDAKADLAITERKLDVINQQLQTIKDQQAKTNEAIGRLKSSLLRQEADFQQALIDAQFNDETDFCQALLPKHERDTLNQQKLAIEQTLSRAKLQLDTTKTALELAQSQALTEQSLPEITLQTEALQADFDNALSEIGGIGQKLLDNEQQKAAQSVQLLNIQQQKENLRVWQQLYELIGSADGKKYRTFAQSLTFEVMINHANQQLQKMSNRYLLVHDSEQPLELSVIDDYQGGEIRSTKNLSGGEGFIISLALALGLSQMASQNIRVDSLFLDEGFGTLDEESLDIALDTLTGLQQEGKLIGVISHVSALKERILTQIQVKKRSGGISVLSGHGCQALAS